MSQWVFSALSGAAVRRDPQETELFKTEDAGEGEYAGTDALVREVIQNSMDAGSGDGPIRVRFAIHAHAELPPADRLACYFRRLALGLAYRDIEFDAAGVPQLAHGFLVCEDFGTRGLGGDPIRATDPPLGQGGEDFFWFWRNIGRSGKTGDALGRWGLGKTVYRAASRVGCMLGLTIRDSDAQALLMGQAVLRIHHHEQTEYAADGFWCGGCNEADIPLPIDAPEALQQFSQEWKLTRRSEPGLSIVVPYVADELQALGLLRLAVVNFFLPVLQQRLVIEVAGPGLPGGQEIRVDHRSVEAVCRQLAWNGKIRQKLNAAPPIAFARNALATSKVHATNLLGEDKVPTMTDQAFDSDTLKTLRDNFGGDKLVAVRVRAALPKKAGGADIGELQVFLQRSPANDRHEAFYVREGMTITRLNSKPSIRGVQALVSVEPGPLASLLGDTEGPAHGSWDTSNDERPNRVWKTWKGRVKFFAKIVDSLVELLSPPPEKADFDLLSDFFSLDQREAPQRKRLPKADGDGDAADEFERPIAIPRWYRLDGKEGGFQICDASQLPTPVGAKLRVTVAYDLPRGNPMKHWSTFDFDFRLKSGPLKLTGRGVKAKLLAGNALELTVTKEDFVFTALGFDIHRDLIVRIDENEDDLSELGDAAPGAERREPNPNHEEISS